MIGNKNFVISFGPQTKTMIEKTGSTNRRKFLSSLAAGTAALSLTTPLISNSESSYLIQDPIHLESWFNSLNGKHKMVFDAVSTNDGLPIVYAYNFISSNNQTGTPDDQLSIVVVLRSKAIALAMDDNGWNKFKLGKMFKIIDYATNAPSDRNLYWEPKEGEMPQSGMSIKALQSRGVKFCVCETALTMTSGQYARSKNQDPATMKKDWISSLLPGVQLVPSGVWALGRAQEHGCGYCYAG
jgi:intracellular sulfur oxidation DsrE/DsrF family protein